MFHFERLLYLESLFLTNNL